MQNILPLEQVFNKGKYKPLQVCLTHSQRLSTALQGIKINPLQLQLH